MRRAPQLGQNPRLPGVIRSVLDQWPSTPDELAGHAPTIPSDKHDELLSPTALARGFVSRNIDLGGALEVVREAFGNQSSSPER